MKLIFAEEDAVFGLLMAAVVLGLTKRYYSVPDMPFLYGILFGVSLILSGLDILHSVTRIHRHIVIIVLHYITNLVDMALELAFIGLFFKVNIPFISAKILPLLQGEFLFFVAIYLFASNAFWLVMYPLTQ